VDRLAAAGWDQPLLVPTRNEAGLGGAFIALSVSHRGGWSLEGNRHKTECAVRDSFKHWTAARRRIDYPIRLRKSVPGELVKPLANAIYRKYQRIIGVLMLIILVTGGINIAYVNKLMKATNGEGFTNPYLIALGIKLFFVMCIMTLFLYNIIFPPEPEEQGRTGDEEKDPEGVPFLRASFWFGIFIVLMASTMKHLHH
jgi:hypothetical protein